MNKKSNNLYQEALKVLVGGVNSPVRAFRSVDINPIFIKQGQGPFLFDVDNNCYIDIVCSYGALLFGHTHPKIISYINENIMKGTSFGSTTEIEISLAKYIIKFIPSIEKVRFVNSGTEATQTSIRIARGFTKKNKIIKFIGCYHGHVDSLLVKSGSGLLDQVESDSAGIGTNAIKDTITCQYNDVEAVKKIFESYSDDIAAIIVEPVAANMNLVLPKNDFLNILRDYCDRFGSLLIFDEVITGFRSPKMSAQNYFGIKPDLTCLGKIMGGGLPIGAIGGESNIMNSLSPVGTVYQAGTLSGNMASVSSGYATLELIDQIKPHNRLQELSDMLCFEMKALSKNYKIDLNIENFGSMIGIRFNAKKEILNIEDINMHDKKKFNKFFLGMLREGIYMAPSPYEISFLSSSHTELEVEKILTASKKVFSRL